MRNSLLVFLFSTIFNCTGLVSYSQIDTSCADVVRSGNIFLWSYAKAKDYITNYIDNYKSKSETHTRAYYLNSTAFLFLDSFFKKYKDYVGLNAHFAIYGHKAGRNQYDDEQFLLYFTPTKSEETKKSDYAVLRNFHKEINNKDLYPLDAINQGTLCPGECDSSITSWSETNVTKTRLEKIGGGYEGFLIYDTLLLKQYKNEYRKKTTFLGTLSKKHTKSIFIDRFKISRIACFLKDSIKTHPAIGIYFGSYNEIKVDSQAHKEQITIGIIPMKKVGKYLEPDPCGYIEHITNRCMHFFNKEENSRSNRAKSENHNELCPYDCPQEGN